jgi:ribonuclease III
MLKPEGKANLTDTSQIQKGLGVSFKDPSLLEESLVHSSYVNENPGAKMASNERLEFLGDAVLGIIVAERLYVGFPAMNEGEMTRLRAVLVCRECLFRMAKSLNLGDYLYMGKGEETSGGRRKPANLAGALEALIGAIYLDRGPDIVREYTLRLVEPELRLILAGEAGPDFKSQLQEAIQARFQQPPAYRVVELTGPDHDRTFSVEVRIGNTILGRGTGKSKKAAEAEAARAAIEVLPTVFTV